MRFSGSRLAARRGVWGAKRVPDKLSLFCSASRQGWRGVDFGRPTRSPTSSLSFAPRLAKAGEAWTFLNPAITPPGWQIHQPTVRPSTSQSSTPVHPC